MSKHRSQDICVHDLLSEKKEPQVPSDLKFLYLVSSKNQGSFYLPDSRGSTLKRVGGSIERSVVTTLGREVLGRRFRFGTTKSRVYFSIYPAPYPLPCASKVRDGPTGWEVLGVDKRSGRKKRQERRTSRIINLQPGCID